MGRRIVWADAAIVAEALFRDDRKRLNSLGLTPFITCDGVPTDARIVDIGRDAVARNGQIAFVLESSEWKEDQPGYHLTAIQPTIRFYTSYATYLEMTKKEFTSPSIPMPAGYFTHPPVSTYMSSEERKQVSPLALSYFPTKRYVRQCRIGVEQSDSPEGPWIPVTPKMLPVGQVGEVQKTDDDVLLWPVAPPVSTFDARIVPDAVVPDLKTYAEISKHFGLPTPEETDAAYIKEFSKGREFI